jgi:hypothetical protein
MVEKEKIKKMAEFRAWLEKRTEEVETELEGLRVLLEFTDTSLLEKGFKRAEMVKHTPTPETALPLPTMQYGETIPLKTVTGDLLADMYLAEDSMRIVPSKDKNFDVNIPPFTSFLVERVLAKMQEKDHEAAGTGEIAPDTILSYNIIRDGDTIREVTIKNIGPERLQELKSTIRWTLEKMYEKMKQTSSV